MAVYSRFADTIWFRVLAGCMGLLVLLAIIFFFASEDLWVVAGVLGVIGLAGFVTLTLLIPPVNRIDVMLSKKLGWAKLKKFRAFSKPFPEYRFVDLFQAVDDYAKGFACCEIVESFHEADLNTIITNGFYNQNQAELTVPPKALRAIAHHEEKFYPKDQFWTVADSLDDPNSFRLILRVRTAPYSTDAILELATSETERAEEITELIVKRSIEKSIYKNKLLQVNFEGGISDEYGEVQSNGVNLAFKQEKEVTKDEIVLDEEHDEMLQRNIFDFHRKREELKKYGIPGKKGVLFYGPPGTGKTYTCQYIYSTLKPVTTLVVTGQSLLQVKSICNLARMLQPSLLVLEDVDLIFASREINLYSTALGDLMDELDGFQATESVTFLLTTNAIERLEEAIKDRPGRINQCIYFGHPNDELRKRYIQRYLRPYNDTDLDLDRVVGQTVGSSQAFIKELIYRAVQVGLEDELRGHNSQVILKNSDFDTAVDEMTKFGGGAAGSIMGFRVQ